MTVARKIVCSVRRNSILIKRTSGAYSGDAISILGTDINETAPTNLQILMYFTLSDTYVPTSLDHTVHLANIGTNAHSVIDSHIADATLHFTEGSISHLNITNIGTNSHSAIDNHIADATLHFTEGSISHLNITNIGTNSHSAIDTHIANASTNPHGVTASQVGNGSAQWNANKIQGITVDDTDIGNGKILAYNSVSGNLEYETVAGGDVSSVFGRTGAVTSGTNDYTWAQIDKTTSDIADITTKAHSSLSGLDYASAGHTGFAASGANTDITSLTGLTSALGLAYGGTGATTQTFVDLTTNQSAGGIKTFTSFPVTPSSAPTSNYQVANKKYVDDNASVSLWQKNTTILTPATAGDDVSMTGDLLSDRYLSSDTNFLAGRNAAGAGNLASGSGYKGWNNVIIGNEAGYNMSFGYRNVFIGTKAGRTYTSATGSVYIGHEAGLGRSGSFDVCIGQSSGKGTGAGGASVFVGYASGYSLTTGFHNISIGYKSSYLLTKGEDNTSLGHESGYSNVLGSSNIFLGYQSGYNETGSNKLYIANSNTTTPLIYGEFDNKILKIYGDLQSDQYLDSDTNFLAGKGACSLGNLAHTAGVEGWYNVCIGNLAGYSMALGSSNICVGMEAGYSTVNGTNNIYLGHRAGYPSIGSDNVCIGYGTRGGGGTNILIGTLAGGTVISSGTSNIVLGYHAGYSLSVGSANVIIGEEAGYSGAFSVSCVMIGYKAGYSETGSNKLYIANSNTTTPLIYGEFDNKILKIHGGLWVNSPKVVTDDDYTILDTDGYSDVDFSTGASDRACTLPTLSANIGRIIWISKTDSGAGKVTISCEGSDTFLDTSTSQNLNNQGDTLAIRGSASGWKIF